MKKETSDVINNYIYKYDFFTEIKEQVLEAFDILINCYLSGNKLLVCGNGGSNSDADHIVGELLKGFTKRRVLDENTQQALKVWGENGEYLAGVLQGSLPAINLGGQASIMTAIINDIGGNEVYAQQLLGLGKSGDVLLGISTSGNSKNILNAGIIAKVLGIKTIALTGEGGGEMANLFDCKICVPSMRTSYIQDMHTPVYHCLCEMIETEYWDI